MLASEGSSSPVQYYSVGNGVKPTESKRAREEHCETTRGATTTATTAAVS